MVLYSQFYCSSHIGSSSKNKGGITIGKSFIKENEKVLLEDTVTYFKSSREVKKCEIYLTDKRVIAYDKPLSFFKSVAKLFKDSETAFEVPLFTINSIRDGQLGPRNIVIFKTTDGAEYHLYFDISGQEWKHSIVDAIAASEPDMTVKEVGDYIKFKRQQPR